MPVDDIKLPPNDNDAEEAILGSILIDSEAIEKVSFLDHRDFYFPVNGDVFKAMMELYKKGVTIDQITLANHLTEKLKLKDIGGGSHLAYLVSVVPTSLDIEYYADIVKKYSVHRQLIAAGQTITGLGYADAGEPADILAKADELIVKLRKDHGRVSVLTPADRADSQVQRYTRLHNLEEPNAVATGFLDLDRQLGGGLFSGELVILAGDSGLGKTTLAQNITHHIAMTGNVLFCSGEMTVDGLTDKELASRLQENVLEIRAGRYSNELYDKIIHELIRMGSEDHVYIYRDVPMKVDGIRQAALEMTTRYGLKAIVIDYLQKLSIPTSRDTQRYLALGEATSALADLAKEVDVPVLLLAQLGSDIDKRENKRPTKADIYESKRIEQDADVILLLYRVDRYWLKSEWDAEWDTKAGARGWKGIYEHGEYPEGIAEIILEKQRIGSGKKKIVKVYFDPASLSYRSLSRQETMI